MSQNTPIINARSTAPRIPDHEVLRCIGKGSYGEVWLARGVTGALRAVKVVRREDFELDRTFEREFEGIMKFEPISRNHPGLVHILHVGRNDEERFYYYVMELADDREHGISIDSTEYEARTMGTDRALRQRLSVEECIEHGAQLAEGLAHLHGHGLTHRDIKPSNIIFVNGQAKLADIGLVAAAGQMTFVGTEGFVPPEGPGSTLADIYSLGMVLYEMSTGKDRMQFPELPDDLGGSQIRPRFRALNDVVLTACSNQPKKRFPTAREMAKALRDAESRHPRRKKNRQIKWLAAGMAAVLMLAFFAMRQEHGPVDDPPAASTGGTGNPPQMAVVQPPVSRPPQMVDPQPPPAPVTGTVSLSSDPPGARIYYQSQYKGLTPGIVEIPPADNAAFTLRLHHYAPVVVTADVSAGENKVLPPVKLASIVPQPGILWENTEQMIFDPAETGHLSRRAVDIDTYLRVTQRTISGGANIEITTTGETIYLVRVAPEDAQLFCDILTRKEQDLGKLTEDLCYRPELYDFKIPAAEVDANNTAKAGNIFFRLAVEPYGRLTVTSDPPGAVVFEGPRQAGTTALVNGVSSMHSVKYRPGKLHFRLTLPGYVDAEVPKSEPEDGVLKSGKELTLHYTLYESKLAVLNKDWKNSLGMAFKPVAKDAWFVPDDLLMGAHEVRVQDYAAYAKEKGIEVRASKFRQGPTHPVVNVTREEARNFCRWLTVKERQEKYLGSEVEYRLPTDAEWSLAAGYPDQDESKTKPSERHRFFTGGYPWVRVYQWPPPPPQGDRKGAGNLGDLTALKAGVLHSPSADVIQKIEMLGYDDGIACTAPAGSFDPNGIGLFDLSGNVWEFVQDDYGGEFPPQAAQFAVLRGGAWNTPACSMEELEIHYRKPFPPERFDHNIGFRVVVTTVLPAARVQNNNIPDVLESGASDDFVGPRPPPGWMPLQTPPPREEPQPMPADFDFNDFE